MTTIRFAGALCVLACAPLAQAQLSISAPLSIRATVQGRTVNANNVLLEGEAPVAGAVSSASPATAAAAVDPHQQARLEKIRALNFDRRPSAILKAWIAPPIKEPKLQPVEEPAEGKEKAPAAPADAKPADAKPADAPQKAEGESASAPTANDVPAATPAPAAEASAAAAPAEAAAANTAATTDDKPKEPAAADADAKKAEAEAAAAKQKEQQRQQQAELRRKANELLLLDYQLKRFQRDVTLGDWPAVKTFLASLPPAEGREAYGRVLESLRSGANGANQANPQLLQRMVLDGADQVTMQQALAAAGQGAGAAFAESNVMAMSDLHGLLVAAPYELDDDAFTKLGTILRLAISAGHDIQELITALTAAPAEGQTAISRRDVARLLFAGNDAIRGGEYLPSLEEARTANDLQALNLLARHYLALHGRDKTPSQLEQAWLATQAALEVELPPEPEEPAAPASTSESPAAAAAPASPEASGEAPKTPTADEAKKKRDALKSEKDAALKRAVDLATRVREELGQAWLNDSFTHHLERGREILVAIGSNVSTNMQSRPQDPDARLKSIELEKSAVAALLRAAPQTAAEWKDIMTVLAVGWLKEAQASYQLSQDGGGRPGYRRDRFGNYYYMDGEQQQGVMRYQENRAQPIQLTKLLENQPSPQWLALVESDLQPKFSTIFAQLHLKAGEPTEAFPFIEQLAKTHPDRAHDLAEEFMRIWTSTHNPNESRDRDPFMYYWGFEQRADRIPLTRSKQQRNLAELSTWVTRLRALPMKPIDEVLLTRAFTTAHSKAEVYRLEAIETVFGSLDQLKPRTLAELIQQMRGNLATVWQMPDVQKQNSTNRRQRDIQAEVIRGYEVARAVIKKGLAQYPDHWGLVLADAAVMHDENDFRQELEKSSEFSPRRQEALAMFARAAELYAKAVGELPEAEQTPIVFEQWFYASLGSVDLGRVRPESVPDLNQAPLIRAALVALPGETAESHMAKFANSLFSHVSEAKPELKYRYLRTGFEIVQDHDLAREARKLLDYYADLVTEIKLEAKVDGATTVGSNQPFGVFVNLLHTKEIERESGGFARYLQNQNSGQMFFYNFGRPLQNYRDKFQATVDQALGEHFEILSVTFQEPDVNSRALPEYGWRVTPYAYVLLKAKGPQIDKIAPLRLDLDFLDTSGYAILPIESPTTPIDAGTETKEPRPYANLSIVQTLDERQAGDGKLLLEVRATGNGLVPNLEELLEVKPAGFDVVSIDDGGVSVTQFDKQAAETLITSERLWTISLQASPSAAERPQQFTFGTAKVPVKDVIYQRYEDSDVVAVEPQIALVGKYEKPQYAWLWWTVPAVAAVLLGAFFVRSRLKRRHQPTKSAYQLPDTLTPFTVLNLLQDIERNNGLTPEGKRDLRTSIDQLEHNYFAPGTSDLVDLKATAEKWVGQSRP